MPQSMESRHDLVSEQQGLEVTFSSIWNFHWGQCKVEFQEGSIQVCSEASEILIL